MLVIGISGSPRVNGNTNLLLDAVLEGSRSENAEVKKFYLANSVHSGVLDAADATPPVHVTSKMISQKFMTA